MALNPLNKKTMNHPLILLYIFLSYMLNVHYCATFYDVHKSFISRMVCIFMFALSPISFPIRLGAMTYDKDL